tara:strand:+ start:173 stop:448 length:276 start_codon:yes stop_codon:yes gene_type:complete
MKKTYSYKNTIYQIEIITHKKECQFLRLLVTSLNLDVVRIIRTINSNDLKVELSLIIQEINDSIDKSIFKNLQLLGKTKTESILTELGFKD